MNSRHLFASALATVFVVAAPVHAQVLRGGAMGAVGGAVGGGLGAGRMGGMGNFGGQAGGAFGGDVDTMGRLNHSASRAAQTTSDAAGMIRDLTLAYNKLRQGRITQELLEIAGGQSS